MTRNCYCVRLRAGARSENKRTGYRHNTSHTRKQYREMQVGDRIAIVTGDTYPHRAALAAAGWVWNAGSTHLGFRKDGTTPKGAWIAPIASVGSVADFGLVQSHESADASDVAAWEARNAPVPAEPATVTPDGAGTGPVRVDVKAWTLREVIAVLRYLRDGSIGYDTARRKKHEMEADLLASFDDGQLLAGYGAVRGAQAPAVAVRPTTTTSARTTPAPAIAGATGGPGLAPGGVEQAIAALVESLAGSQVAALDEARVREIAHEEATGMLEHVARIVEDAVKGASRTIDVRLPDKSIVTLTGAHPAFDEVLALAVAGLNVLLVGPAGCGKTHLCEMIAQAVKARRFGTLSCTAGTTESALEGRLLPVRVGGTFCYLPSVFVDIYQHGGVFLFDEIDAADPNLLLVVNTALANGHMEIASRVAGDKDGNELETRITRHKDCLLLAAANTYGNGATSQYTGRSALDAATKDRFFVVPMDYDRAFERSLFAGRGADAEAFGEWVWSVRECALVAGLHHVVSSRMIAKGVTAIAAGLPIATVKKRSLAGWSANDLRAVGEVA